MSVDRQTTTEEILSGLTTVWQEMSIVKAKLPLNHGIIIQQDGAKAHILDNDPCFKAKVADLYDGNRDAVKMYTQPAQSPDLNVNDLGFFNSLQSHNYKESPKDALELIVMVKRCYNNYPSTKLNRIWLTLQSCMNCIIDDRGGNQYKIPHMCKDRLERLGQLPTTIPVTKAALEYPLQDLLD